MIIDEILENPKRRDYAGIPEADALTQIDALQEADLRDIRYDLTSSTLSILFDLRNALQFRIPDVAVLVLREVKCIELKEIHLPFQWSTRYVMFSKPEINDKRFTFELGCLDGLLLSAESMSAEFFVGDIPGLPEAPPNFGDDDEQTIISGMPAWSSEFVPGWATFIDRHPDLRL